MKTFLFKTGIAFHDAEGELQSRFAEIRIQAPHQLDAQLALSKIAPDIGGYTVEEVEEPNVFG